MTDDLDPKLLELFAQEQRRPIDEEPFIAEILAGLEREEQHNRRRRHAILVAILIVVGLAVSWTLPGLTSLARELASEAQFIQAGADLELQGLQLVMLCVLAYASSALWRLLRSAR